MLEEKDVVASLDRLEQIAAQEGLTVSCEEIINLVRKMLSAIKTSPAVQL